MDMNIESVKLTIKEAKKQLKLLKQAFRKETLEKVAVLLIIDNWQEKEAQKYKSMFEIIKNASNDEVKKFKPEIQKLINFIKTYQASSNSSNSQTPASQTSSSSTSTSQTSTSKTFTSQSSTSSIQK